MKLIIALRYTLNEEFLVLASLHQKQKKKKNKATLKRHMGVWWLMVGARLPLFWLPPPLYTLGRYHCEL